MDNRGKNWVSFRYERLPKLCYWSGRLNHSNKDCMIWIECKGTLSTEKQHFGSYLRASPYS